MTIIKIDVDLERERPVEYAWSTVRREEGGKLVFGRDGKKISRGDCRKPILKDAARGVYYLTLGIACDSMTVRAHPSVQLGTVILLEAMQERLQRCAVRLREALEEVRNFDEADE